MNRHKMLARLSTRLLVLSFGATSAHACAQAPTAAVFGDTWQRYEYFSRENMMYFKVEEWPTLEGFTHGQMAADDRFPKMLDAPNDPYPIFFQGFYVAPDKRRQSVHFTDHVNVVTPGHKRDRAPGCTFHGPYANMTGPGRIDAQIVLTGDFTAPPVSEGGPAVDDINFPIMTYQLVSSKGVLSQQLLLPAAIDKSPVGPQFFELSQNGKPLVLGLSVDVNEAASGVAIRLCDISIRTRFNIARASVEFSR